MLMVLAVFVVSIAANGYADPLSPTEHRSGPALVGTLTLIQTGTDVTVIFSGKCRGDDASFFTAVGGLTIATMTAASLKDLRLPGVGLSVCQVQANQTLLSDNLAVNTVVPPSDNLVVNTEVSPKFTNNGTVITAEVVLLYVVPK